MHGTIMNQGLKQAAVADDFDLTRLELIGLTLVANGMQSAEAATRLSVSEREIETLLFCAQRKLGAKNRVHAIAIAIRQGLIGIEV
jgi:LuxR family transcriptional regulator, quorum-sensing system regulator SdiA